MLINAFGIYIKDVLYCIRNVFIISVSGVRVSEDWLKGIISGDNYSAVIIIYIKDIVWGIRGRDLCYSRVLRSVVWFLDRGEEILCYIDCRKDINRSRIDINPKQ